MKYIKNLIVIMVVGLLIGSLSFGEVVQPTEEVKEEVFSSAWSENSIKAIKYNKVFDDFFYSNYQDNLTHKEACYMMVKMYEKVVSKIELEALKPDQNEHVEKAKKLGILKDIDFKENKAITREEYAHIFRSTIEIMPSGFGVKIGSTPFEQDVERPHFEFKYHDENSIDKRYIGSVYKMRLNGILNGVRTPSIKDADGNVISEWYITYYPKNNITKEEALLSIISASTKAMKGVVTKPIAYFNIANNQLSDNRDLFSALKKYGKVTDGQGSDYESSNILIGGRQISYSQATHEKGQYEFSVRYYSDDMYKNSSNEYYISILFKHYNPTIKEVLNKILNETLDEERGNAFVANIDKNIMSTVTESGGYKTSLLDGISEDVIKDRCRVVYRSGLNYLGVDLFYKKDFK